MESEAPSAWLIIGPALIAGSIGFASALISFSASERALKRAASDARDTRAHQRTLLIWDRRLVAIETVWQRLFDLERSMVLSEDARAELVRAVVWLPERTGREVLTLVLAFNDEASGASHETLARLRQALLESVTVEAYENRKTPNA